MSQSAQSLLPNLPVSFWSILSGRLKNLGALAASLLVGRAKEAVTTAAMQSNLEEKAIAIQKLSGKLKFYSEAKSY